MCIMSLFIGNFCVPGSHRRESHCMRDAGHISEVHPPYIFIMWVISSFGSLEMEQDKSLMTSLFITCIFVCMKKY